MPSNNSSWRTAITTPFGQFTLLVAAIIVAGSVIIAASAAILIERFFVDETQENTARAVEFHFYRIFRPDIFTQELSQRELLAYNNIVGAHFDVYDIVQARFYRPNGAIVFSYDPAEIGLSVKENRHRLFDQALKGVRAVEYEYARNVRAALAGPSNELRPDFPTKITIDALHMFLPISRDGMLIGIVEVERDVSYLQQEIRIIQLIVIALVILVGVTLFLALGGVFQRSTDQVLRHARAEQEALSRVSALQELSRLKDEFISVVSHELRTPLTHLVASSELLLNRDQFTDEARRFLLETIHRESRHMTEIVEDLVDVSRIEAGLIRLDRRMTDLAPVIQDVVKPMSTSTEKHRFVVKVDPSLPQVFVDPIRINQALTNLLTNAVRYSPAGGEIRVSGTLADGEVQVSVADQGIGIPADKIDRIFEKFYRIESDLTHEVRGSGLGLSIVREMVTAHGGRVWVESTVGKGSAFYFTIPLSSSPTAANRKDAIPAGAEAATEG